MIYTKKVIGTLGLVVFCAVAIYAIREYLAESKMIEADQLRVSGQLDAAIALYDASDSIRPGDSRTLNNRGIAHMQKGDFEMAVLDFSAAIRVAPYAPFAYENRSLAFEKLGQPEKSEADAKQGRLVRAQYEGH